MEYSDERHHLHVEINARDCTIPADERARMETALEELGDAVQDFPASQLWMNVIYHARSALFHVEFKLKLPGRTLFTGERGEVLDLAFERGLRKLLRRVETYKQHPDPEATEKLERHLALENEIVAPEDPDFGPLAMAVDNGDYRAFRMALALYEEWLRKRAGRWVQRYPDAEAQVGRALRLGDLVEEIYLNAFEEFPHRPTAIRFSEWLDSLVDPSLKILLRHPDRESENASFARTVRDMRVG